MSSLLHMSGVCEQNAHQCKQMPDVSAGVNLCSLTHKPGWSKSKFTTKWPDMPDWTRFHCLVTFVDSTVNLGESCAWLVTMAQLCPCLPFTQPIGWPSQPICWHFQPLYDSKSVIYDLWSHPLLVLPCWCEVTPSKMTGWHKNWFYILGDIVGEPLHDEPLQFHVVFDVWE